MDIQKIIICVADCNHGFFTPEYEEAERLANSLKMPISVQYKNCTQFNLISRCAGADVLVVQRLQLDGKTLDKIPTCKVVVRLGVGLDNINVDEMQSRGIRVINFPSFCIEEVANHATAFILSSYRRLDHIYKADIPRLWGRGDDLLRGTRKASETVVGILGFGRIGTSVSARLKVCGFHVMAHDPYVDISEAEAGVDQVSIEDLFMHSDIVSIHCSLTDETRGLVNKNLLKLMSPGSAIINTARGPVVNSSDLNDALEEGQLRSAHVDVYDPEPIDPSLLDQNLYITSHVAFYSWDSLDYLKREWVKKSVEAICEK